MKIRYFISKVLVTVLLCASIHAAVQHPNYVSLESSRQLPLFKAYPRLFDLLPHRTLGSFPTPIKKLKNLGDVVHFENIYIKQDGLSGTVSSNEQGHIFGGNKVRKLEFLLADALRLEANTIITVGAAGSNHALATAIYSKILGLECIVMLTPQVNTSYTKRNLLMDLFYASQVRAYESDAQRQVDIVNTSRDYFSAGKNCPYLIPMGGSDEIGVIGFANAAFELKEQIEKNELPEPDLIYVAAGSCGTAAGLILGAKAIGLKSKIKAVRISGTHESKVRIITDLVTKSNTYLHEMDKNFPILEIKEGIDYEVVDGFDGNGYAKTTIEGAEAIKTLNLAEKIQLDGTYTGKAFAAMLADIKKPEMHGKVILFWNTYCSGNFSDITQNIDYNTLPKLLKIYFDGTSPMQHLDQGC